MAKKNSEVTHKALLLSLLMCVSLQVSAAKVIVENAWIKLAPPGMTSHAAYLQLNNISKQALVIKHVSAENYERVMLHQTKLINDRVQMEHLETLVVPAQSSLVLSPGATHLMLMGPRRPQKLNEPVVFTLTFSDDTQEHFTAIVKPDGE